MTGLVLRVAYIVMRSWAETFPGQQSNQWVARFSPLPPLTLVDVRCSRQALDKLEWSIVKSCVTAVVGIRNGKVTLNTQQTLLEINKILSYEKLVAVFCNIVNEKYHGSLVNIAQWLQPFPLLCFHLPIIRDPSPTTTRAPVVHPVV